MTKRILAFFACSFLTVALTIPALAEEVGGTIEEIDRERSQLKLSDGSIYILPDNFDFEQVSPGMDVVLLVEAATPITIVS